MVGWLSLFSCRGRVPEGCLLVLTSISLQESQSDSVQNVVTAGPDIYFDLFESIFTERLSLN